MKCLRSSALFVVVEVKDDDIAVRIGRLYMHFYFCLTLASTRYLVMVAYEKKRQIEKKSERMWM